MPAAQLIQNLSLGGASISPPPVSRTFDYASVHDVTLPSAKPLTSWVKTDGNTAGGNLPGGHGWSNGNFDVYWTGGKRLGVPGTISTNALTLDGGTGDDFPASADTTVRVVPEHHLNAQIDGDELSIFGMMLEGLDADAVGSIRFYDADDDLIATLDLARNDPTIIDVEGGASNPLAGDPIAYGLASQSSTTQTGQLKILVGADSTP